MKKLLQGIRLGIIKGLIAVLVILAIITGIDYARNIYKGGYFYLDASRINMEVLERIAIDWDKIMQNETFEDYISYDKEESVEAVFMVLKEDMQELGVSCRLIIFRSLEELPEKYQSGIYCSYYRPDPIMMIKGNVQPINWYEFRACSPHCSISAVYSVHDWRTSQKKNATEWFYSKVEQIIGIIEDPSTDLMLSRYQVT